MAKTKEVKPTDPSTEEKIKEAARVVFHKKGYAATRTRDIAQEAGINLALLNYYFRSKQKLFEIIMFETVFAFMKSMTMLLNDEKTTLEEKVELIASNYIDFISKEPNVPMFMLSEFHNNSGGLPEKLPIQQTIRNSAFLKQHQKAVELGDIAEPNPMHFLMNLLGLIIFPFIAKPIVQTIGDLTDPDFHLMMQDRKKNIPVWIKAIMKAK